MKKILLLIFLIVNCLLPIVSFGQNAWVAASNFGGTARYGAVGFSIGTKGYIGTGYDGARKQDFWEYDGDPSSSNYNTWTQKANFPGTARFFAAAFSIGAKGYIGTGSIATNTGSNDFWEWDGDLASPNYNTWTSKTTFPGGAIWNAHAFSIGANGYMGIGTYCCYPHQTGLWEYDTSNGGSWTPKASFGGGARELAACFSIGTKGYIGTGTAWPSYPCYSDFWEYNPVAGGIWTQKANFPGPCRDAAVGFSIGTKGYIGTGAWGSVFKDFWEWDGDTASPTYNTWTQKVDMCGARYYAVGFSIGSYGYVGTGLNSSNLNDFWRFDPTKSGTACTSFLPIELLSFSAQCTPIPNGAGRGVGIHWQTASEQNNDYFTIERAAAPPNLPIGEELNWQATGIVKGTGNSSTIHSYEFIDPLPNGEGKGVGFYRLKQTDYDGKYEYFGPISVTCEPTNEWELILQNTPATDELLGTLFSPEDATVRVEILDLHGRKIDSKQLVVSKGSNFLKFDLKNIDSGVYFIRVSNKEKQVVKKFVKQ